MQIYLCNLVNFFFFWSKQNQQLFYLTGGF